jgi:AcrR family transcriptional regulator
MARAVKAERASKRDAGLPGSPAQDKNRQGPATKARGRTPSQPAAATSPSPSALVLPGQSSGRAARQARRRHAILAAALEEFATRGFAATRIDDVAERAAVAKGTIYLHFRDKETLFQELVRSMLSPIVSALEAAPLADLPARALAEMVADLFVREVFGTRRKDVIRLIITEGPRFPKIAEFYYHEVIERVLPPMRALMARAVARGELPNDALARFPQLLIAPGLVAIVWNGLFDRFASLDIGALMRAHIDLIFGERNGS